MEKDNQAQFCPLCSNKLEDGICPIPSCNAYGKTVSYQLEKLGETVEVSMNLKPTLKSKLEKVKELSEQLQRAPSDSLRTELRIFMEDAGQEVHQECLKIESMSKQLEANKEISETQKTAMNDQLYKLVSFFADRQRWLNQIAKDLLISELNETERFLSLTPEQKTAEAVAAGKKK